MCANDEIRVNARKFSLNNSLDIGYLNTSKLGGHCINHTLSVPITWKSDLTMYWMDVNIPFNSVDNSSINNNQLDDILESYYIDKNYNVHDSSIPNNILKLAIIVKIDMPDTRYNGCSSYNPKAFYFQPRQAFFIYVTPKFTDLEKGCIIDLDLQSEQLPLNLDTNIGLGIYINIPKYYEKLEIYGFYDFLSNIGGIYGILTGILLIIFGASKIGPWSLKHYILSSALCIGNSTKYFKDKYKKSLKYGGIPLVEEVKKRPGRKGSYSESLSSLEDRVQMLEDLLKDYYLDDSLF
ncbi:hypothetical protein RhiirA4_509242 [Rhizophagus irregularis]|uniref:Uncharacterized protein n=1 Tax=Rhizophagus irregularis TaxID=588596 RepID=A0A2I1HE79_9GLOM|nr:hypothetical protein RhiirA4_509242 [Rhizophagus irregularis]